MHKMNAIFMEQVQLLLHKQSRITHDNITSKYGWLSKKRTSTEWLSIRSEYKMLQMLKKLNDDQKIKILKNIINWVQETNAKNHQIVEITFGSLSDAINEESVKDANLSRMASFRNSLRRFSKATNKIVPIFIKQNAAIKGRRSVTFDETPVVYKIS